MVRLVFRPYTQLRRSICTSESRRTSTRVSSGFILARHSSPSFGSQRVGSRSAPQQCSEKQASRWRGPRMRRRQEMTTDLRSCRQTTLHFHCAFEIRQSQSLAHMLDSLVRVSRRAARDDAKAEPTLASRFALAVAQSFAYGIASQTKPTAATRACTFSGAPTTSEDASQPDTAL